MQTRPSGWSATAFNQVPDSANQIHSDAMAAAYGFTGALVPGVTISAYLLHPAVVAWGLPWLARGQAHVVVQRPLYDTEPFEVSVTAVGANRYDARLESGGRHVASAEVELPDALPDLPRRRHWPWLDPQAPRPAATPDSMATLQAAGGSSMRFRWAPQHPMARYLRDATAMPVLLQPNPEGTGCANTAFLLGCANNHFAAIAHMNPWIHLETRSQHFDVVAAETALVSELVIESLFERKGHAFCDCIVTLFREADDGCVCRIEQRAIYRPRPPGD